MSETPRFHLPLLDPAQAQKHVTVNEALSRADALSAGKVEAVEFAPPSNPPEGAVYIIGTAADGEWAGLDDQIALRLNGGWEYVAPWPGASFWIAEESTRTTFDGSSWVPAHSAGAAGGAATILRVIEADHALEAGPLSVTGPVIPDKAVVIGVTARVLTGIEGATAWSLGADGSPDRYGSGYGTAAGAFAHGVTGQPQAYFAPTALEITAEGGDFTGGTIRLAVHYIAISPPRAI